MSKQSELVGLARTTNLDEVNAAYSAGALSNRNVILNGSMQVAQRGASFNAPQNYTLDRWKSLRYAANSYTVSLQPTGGLSGFSKCARIQRNAGDTTSGNNPITFNQPVEQKSCDGLIGKTVTLSFWVRVGSDFSANTSSFYSAVAYTTNTTDIGMYYGNFYSNGTSLSQVMPVSTSWTYVTHIVAIPSSAKQVGVAFSGDYWAGTAGANDYYEITGVQLEVGDTATPFEHRSYGQELALCQRYYQECIIKDRVFCSYNNSSASYGGSFQWRTVMRVAPTAQGGTNASAYASDNYTAVPNRQVMIQTTYAEGCQAYLDYDTAGAHTWFVRADSFLLDAEL